MNNQDKINKIELQQKIGKLELKQLKLLLKGCTSEEQENKLKEDISIKRNDLRLLVWKKANLKRPSRKKLWKKRLNGDSKNRYCCICKIILKLLSANQNSKKFICKRCETIHIIKEKKK